PGAAFMPRLILIYSGIFILIWLFQLLRPRQVPNDGLSADTETDGTFQFEYRDYLITIAAVIAFVLGVDWLGFEITSFAILAILLYFRMQNITSVIAISAITTFVMYFVFVLLLNVSIPLAFLPSYISF